MFPIVRRCLSTGPAGLLAVTGLALPGVTAAASPPPSPFFSTVRIDSAATVGAAAAGNQVRAGR